LDLVTWERQLKSRLTSCAGRYVALVGVALAASSCFDAHQVDPGSLLLQIDNFDDGVFPTDSTFMPWNCFSFNSNTTYSCEYDDGDTFDGTEHSLRLDFTDPPGDTPQNAGAALVTRAARGLSRDVTPFKTLWLDAKVQSGLPSNPDFYVQLGCGGAYVLQKADFYSNGNWTGGIPLPLAEFGPPDMQTLPEGLAGCLAAIDEIDVVLAGELQGGQAGTGTVKIDNVHLTGGTGS
jgi:hypothetical protein